MRGAAALWTYFAEMKKATGEIDDTRPCTWFYPHLDDLDALLEPFDV